MAAVIAEKAPPKIFVSGTTSDLGSCHLIICDALLSLGWEPVQDLAAQDGTARERLREKIAGCEAVVYLVGECYGAEAPQSISNPLRSFAQLAFDIAWELDKPICVLLFAEDFPFDTHDPEPAERLILQRQHRIALCADEKRCLCITNRDELADSMRRLLPRAEGSQLSAPIRPVVEGSELSNEPLGAGLPAGSFAIRKRAFEVGSSPLVSEELGSVHPQPPALVTPVGFQENVQFTAYRPKVIAPAKWTKMLVFAHLDDRPDWLDDSELGPIEEMEQEAARILGSKIEDYQSTTSDSSLSIPKDSEITLIPEVSGIEFNPPRRAFLWKDGITVHHETFDMRATAKLDGQTTRGRLTIFRGPLILAEIRLSIRVGHAIQHASGSRESSSARAFRRVFMSYSHRDLRIVEAAERYGSTLGDEYIRDLIYLRSGEFWNDQLQQLVRWADVFQLFWSMNAAGSKYVEDEWRYALTLNRPRFVRPTYWQEPMPEPPEPLRSLHFSRLIPETQSEALQPSTKSDPSLKPDLSLPIKEMPRFMPSSPAPDYSGRSFMPSEPVPYPSEPRPAPSVFHTGWSLRGKLIVLGLVVAIILLLAIISLTRLL